MYRPVMEHLLRILFALRDDETKKKRKFAFTILKCKKRSIFSVRKKKKVFKIDGEK